jgi:hypothetical protein
MGDGTAADCASAVVAHLYYPDVGLEILDRLELLAGRFHLVVTTPPPLDSEIARRLARWPGHVEIVETENRGRDVGPFLAVLPDLLERGCQVCLKLHTKGRRSPFSHVWRHCAYDALIGSEARLDAILGAFAADPSLALAGPAPLFVSAAAHLFGNAEALQRAAGICLPGRRLPEDWGFFAGTMFWARVEALRPFLELKRFGVAFGAASQSGDGELEHAIERLFGLAGVIDGRKTAIIDASASGHPELCLAPAPAALDGERLSRRLIALKRQALRGVGAGEFDPPTQNPLLHYIKSGPDGELDPNPLFFNAWYAASLETPLDPGTTPLAHFIRQGWRDGRNPSPLFDTAEHLDRHPNSLNPLAAGLAARRRSPPDAPAPTMVRPRSAWPQRQALRRSIDPTVEHAFVAAFGGETNAAMLAAAKRVSVCVPLLDRDDDLSGLLGAILEQSHPPAEVIVAVSSAAARSVATRVRERSIAGAKILPFDGSAPAALNLALAACSGDLVAYLQPDRRWRPDHLRLLTTLIVREGVDAAASVAAFSEGGRIYAYLGGRASAPDGEAAPIDLSALCHKRALALQIGVFAESLPAPIAEFARRCTAAEGFVLAPFAGCECSTVSYAIKTAAELGDRNDDERAAIALADALRKAGASVRVDYRGAWYDAEPSPANVVVALRGRLRYEPKAGEINVLLHIGGNEPLDPDEAEDFDLVLVASEAEADFLRLMTSRPVAALPPPAGEERADVDCAAHMLTGGNLAASLAGDFPADDARSPARTPLMRAYPRRRRIRIIHRPVAGGFHSSTYIRVLAPLLHPTMPRAEISAAGVNDIDGAEEADVCIVVRSAIDDAEVADTLIERLRRSGSQLIVDLDDAFRLVEETDPWFAMLRARSAVMDRLLGAADQCWMSTPRLAAAYSDLPRRADVIPNGLDPRRWQGAGLRSSFASRSPEKLHFLCMGSRRHAEDFGVLMPALDQLSQSAPGAFHVTVVGMAPRLPKRPWLEHRFPARDAAPYVPFVAWLRRQGPFHVGLAPLRDTPFNACKSDIKFLDYSALGLLSVLSDVPAYHGDARARGLAVFADNTTESWHEALFRLVSEGPSREIALSAQAYVWEEREVGRAAAQQSRLLGFYADQYSSEPAARRPAQLQGSP